MSALKKLLLEYRQAATTEREKGTYFEELIRTYLRNEPVYRDLYSKVWLYADWAVEQGLDARDTGIDLVAQTAGTNEFHAIQCKFYAPEHKVEKKDIDSFFTASGQRPFTHRIIVSTTNLWTDNAKQAIVGQQPPVTKIDLNDLENSQIDWADYQPSKRPTLKCQKTLRPHQIRAKNEVIKGLKAADRGKLIMACGTGKTYTSLKIAEELAGAGKRVLFLVPSLSLLSQSLTEWTQESSVPLHSFAVCSDAEVGKKRKKDEDVVETFVHELRYPATTDAKHVAEEMGKRHDERHMSVVFSTYHSIDVLGNAQKLHGLPAFDLVICDEAHRTTGAIFDNQDESNFTKVHNNDFLKAAKRLYMTATPRIYSDMTKAEAENDNVLLCSMDDASIFGEELYVIPFTEAVSLGLLTDYKVIVLAIDEAHISARLQNLFKDEDNTLKVDDAARIIGCWKALAKHGIRSDLIDDVQPMRRAVAFCQVIEIQKGAKTHKVSSKEIARMFRAVVDAYNEKEPDRESLLACEADHVDGSMNATEKDEKLDWLKENPSENTCRILSNVRCLSEGVDVPALDAVLFLTPRNSQVEVVQSVGRVMRNAQGKKRGYVILPVVIPAGVDPADALNDNKTYRIVWEVLQALRSHDDRFDAFVNKLDLSGKNTQKMEVIAITDAVPKKTAALSADKGRKKSGKGEFNLGKAKKDESPEQLKIHFDVGALERALYAKVVKKCGNRYYWDDWAKDIAKIAQTHITRITTIVSNPDNLREVEAFKSFANELRDDLNDSITDGEVIEMLAQHLITKPVFDALFKDYSFASNNPVSLAMQKVLDILQEHRIEKEADTLEKFYASVRMRADGIEDVAAKQKIVIELYDKFFRNAFPKMTERLGIVYTPVEVVDFIIHSVNDLLKKEFGKTLADDGVHILDPFTGTGTFITRLLQSGLIPADRLAAKYGSEIHANEIVLLAYYIATINIESVYHAIVGGDYRPFSGICLTDTFRLEEEDLISDILAGNSDRRKRQQKLPVRVIIGNPPYSSGQESANDNNQNVAYPTLDKRIRETYAASSTATNNNALYDSYIRAIRWASDRISLNNTAGGIIGFVTNGGFLDSNSADGLRKCLVDEFSSLHIFHLRGNQRTSGELSRKEGGKIFGSGSRAPIAISLLVKNPVSKEHGQIRFHDIGDYLTTEQKLQKIAAFKSVEGIAAVNGWQSITPDAHGDWLKQRDDSFAEHIVSGDKKSNNPNVVFENYSNGLKTQRDAWCYNFSSKALNSNMERMIEFYNSEVVRLKKEHGRLIKGELTKLVSNVVDTNPVKISWTQALFERAAKLSPIEFDNAKLIASIYRPFGKQWLYYDRQVNERAYQIHKIFPKAKTPNLVIQINAKYSGYGQLALMSDCLPDLHCNGDTQCFPLYLYETNEPTNAEEDGGLFGEGKKEFTRRDAITDYALDHFRQKYPESGSGITKENVFYYIYGILHSQDYRERFADNLSKELPRIPAVKSYDDFRKFAQAGRDLAELHINYEKIAPYKLTFDLGVAGAGRELKPEHYRVTKMKFASKGDKSVVIYNEYITLRDIPLDAYDYVVNGKPALEWVMERQCVKTDKDSGIVNDANLWATETMHDPQYPLKLYQSIITVSLRTNEIVKNLPKLDID